MLTDRIIGAVTFRKGVYSEVEHDASFTGTAWMLVAIVALLNQLGANAGWGFSKIGTWLLSAIAMAVFEVVGFAVAAYIISWVGKTLYNADVTFDEMVRTLGLAYVWRIIGFVGVLGAISGALTCLLAPVTIAAWIAGLVAWFIAVNEALDLELAPTVVTLVIGFIINLIIGLIAGAILAIFGLGAAAITGVLQ